ncbi:uncharacterized protein K02A2.6-like [Strongylocentrotus purpuratus]|uniref:RNA-directed DNA polymerase n=1 Tax=Strongylocentrotus purpuratus TaxID=7668 RepID=A0A7M7NDL7_STRPU|nr:uncharacterized protein K02A2.6-like [Strongylocentrotus purpuratus]
MAFAGAELLALRGVPHFDPTGGASIVSGKWKAWLEEFEAYADSRGLFLDGCTPAQEAQRRALLLYTAGPVVRETFKTLPNKGERNEYQKATDALNAHYVVKPNATFQRHLFRKTKQEDGETVAQFVTKLRQVAIGCNFVAGDVENQILDQVVQYCRADKLRRRMLEKGGELKLNDALSMAAALEAVEGQFNSMSLRERERPRAGGQVQVNQVSYENDRKKNLECYRCGNKGHFGKDASCPAKGKICRKCGGQNHFATMCKSKAKSTSEARGKFRDGKSRDGKKYKNRVRQVEGEPGNDSDDDNSRGRDQRYYQFAVNGDHEKVPIIIGGVTVPVIVDSGSDCNVIDQILWEKLKKDKIICKSTKSTKRLYPYTSQIPLTTVGCFTATVEVGKMKSTAEFVVIKEKGEPLLSKHTSRELGVLQVGIVHVNAVQSYAGLKHEFEAVFKGVGKLKGRQVRLAVDETVKPVAQPVRRTPFGLRKKVEMKIAELIDLDIIEPVERSTPWVSPVVIVPKRNDEIRLCIDMRRVNEAIIRERHPIPTIEEVLQELSISKVFSKIDLKWGYHQLELHPESREVTTFVTHCGLFRYKRLLFGINAAPEIYQYEIHRVIAGIEGAANISDDIIVHASTQKEHDKRLKQVLSRLRDAGLTANAEKCKFGVSELDFMGHRLTSEGLNPGLAKVKAIAEAREPQTATEMRSFLGLVNYCAKFIPNFATLADPLRKLTRKDTPFQFGHEQQQAFKALKESLMSAETLGYYDLNAPTKVIADASPVGLGAVLVQVHADGPRIVAYASRSLSNVERRYSQTEKEALGLVWACERFHAYLYGIEFDLVTDHKPLEVIYSPRSKPCARIERWVLRLQQYKYRVVHIAGKSNIADPLSRLLKDDQPRETSVLETEAESFVRFVAVQSTPGAVTTKEVERESEHDPELEVIRECIHSGQWDDCPYKAYIPIKDELCIIGQCVLRGSRLVIPQAQRPKMVSLAHEGHLGIVGTKQNLRTKVWWPGCEKDAEKFVKTCHGCQITSRGNPPEPIRSTMLPTGPWVDVAVDFLGPLPTGESILVVVDYYSRYYEYAIMKSTTAEKTVKARAEIFGRHGLPVTLYSDNGPQFISEVFAEYMNITGIHHHRVTPKWPQANGEVERQNQSIVKRLRIAQAEGKDWKEALLTYVAVYRASTHSTTGKSPAEVLFGRKIRTKLPQIQDISEDQELRDRDLQMKSGAKHYADLKRGAVHSDIVPGDKVIVRRDERRKLDTPYFSQPYTVTARTGSMVTVKSPDGVLYNRNVSSVKRYMSRDTHNEAANPERTDGNPEAVTGIPEGSDDNPEAETSTPEAVTRDPDSEAASNTSGGDQRHQDGDTQAETTNTNVPMAAGRPQRQRRFPKRYDDFV